MRTSAEELKLRWLAVITTLAATSAASVLYGIPSGLIVNAPLIAACATVWRWPRIGHALMYFGAIWTSVWVLPWAFLCLIPSPPRPNLLVILVSIPAVLFIPLFDVLLVITYFRAKSGRIPPL